MTKVSVVVPVYNVEKYLQRCLDCILGQTLREIEVICVDDGSSDGSGAILDDRAERDARIRVVHQPNAGAGAARNAGLSLAGGEYLFFFDPDDTCSRKMLEGMYGRAKRTDADIVIAGKATVDAETGRIVAKYGFHRDIWRLRQPFSGEEISDHVFTLAKSVPWDKLFRRQFVEDNGLRFQEIPRSNDVFFVDMALSLAKRIALIPRAYYNYSLDRAGSLQSNKDKTPYAFLEAYRALERGLRARGRFATFAASFSRVFLRTSLFNLRMLREPENVRGVYREVRADLLRLAKEHDFGSDTLLYARHRQLCGIIQRSEDPMSLQAACVKFRSQVAEQGGDGKDDDDEPLATGRLTFRRFVRRYLPIPLREAIKRMRVLYLRRVSDRIAVNASPLRNGMLRLNFATLSHERLELRFTYCVYSSAVPSCLPGRAALAIETPDGQERCELVAGAECAERAILRGVVSAAPGRRFVARIPLRQGQRHVLRWQFAEGDAVFDWSWVKIGPFSSVGMSHASYFRQAGWIVSRDRETLTVVPDTPQTRIRAGLGRLLWIARHPSAADAKALAVRLLAAVYGASLGRRPLLLFADRPDRADDNARALFEHAVALPRTKDSPRLVFAIDRKSPDWKTMSGIGRTVDIGSWLYKVMFVRADAVISAYRTKAQRMPFDRKTVACLREVFAHDYRFVFLRHGICEKDVSDDLCRERVNPRLIMAATEGERRALLSDSYGYTDREVRLTGMPRYDKLYDDRKGCITFMPTWRSYLTRGAGTNALLDREAFAETAFCRAYRAVFADSAFAAACARKGFRLRLMMHPNMRDSEAELGICKEIEILPAQASYRDVFATSDLVVTDYSSVAFDVAYLKKPVLYYQFDAAEFFGAQYKKADFFEYARDGFGEVEETAEALKTRILEYVASGCRMKPEYVARVDRFFAFTDRNNCRRVYEAVLDMVREERG